MIDGEIRDAKTASPKSAVELSYRAMQQAAVLMKNEDSYVLRCEIYDKWSEARDIFFGALRLGSAAGAAIGDGEKDAGKNGRSYGYYEGWAKSLVFRPDRRISFEGVVGHEDAVETLQLYIVKPLQGKNFPGSRRRKRILLYGPPGTGKTMLAYAAACEAGVPFLDVKVTDVFSKYLGDTEKKIGAVFDYAENNAPVIIHFDEIDAIGKEGFQRLRATVLNRLDGLSSKASDKPVVMLGSTNMPWKLERAFAQRFQHHIYAKPPDRSAKEKILSSEIADICSPASPSEFVADLSRVSKAAECMEADARGIWTGRDIRTYAELLFELAARDKEFRGGDGIVREEHFLRAFEMKAPVLTRDKLNDYERWASGMGL